jgi:hypothetical protein
MFLTDWTLDIALNVWTREQGIDPERDNVAVPRGHYNAVFDCPVNIFGSDGRHEINKNFDVNGYAGRVLWGSYNSVNNTVIIRFMVDRVPEPQAGAVVPLALVIGGVIFIVGGVIALALLTKFQKVISLPIIPFILAFVALVYLYPKLSGKTKSKLGLKAA